MSISGVNSIGVAYPIVASTQSSGSQGAFGAFEQLASALQSGDLASAQKAYNSITPATQNSSRTQAGTQVSSDLTAVGQALQSGNLSGARQAFSNLQQAARQGGFGAHVHHHHHAGGGGAGQLQSTAQTNSPADSLFKSPSASASSSNSGASALTSIANTATSLLNILT